MNTATYVCRLACGAGRMRSLTEVSGRWDALCPKKYIYVLSPSLGVVPPVNLTIARNNDFTGTWVQ